MKITRLSENQRFVFRWWTARDLSDYDGIICDGAVRSGKTFCLSASFMTWAMTNFDECIFGLCSKTIVSLKRNILPAFYIIGNFDKFPIIQKALRAGCARRNKEILPLCGIAAARKVDKPLD